MLLDQVTGLEAFAYALRRSMAFGFKAVRRKGGRVGFVKLVRRDEILALFAADRRARGLSRTECRRMITCQGCVDWVGRVRDNGPCFLRLRYGGRIFL